MWILFTALPLILISNFRIIFLVVSAFPFYVLAHWAHYYLVIHSTCSLSKRFVGPDLSNIFLCSQFFSDILTSWSDLMIFICNFISLRIILLDVDVSVTSSQTSLIQRYNSLRVLIEIKLCSFLQIPFLNGHSRLNYLHFSSFPFYMRFM